MRGQIRKGIKMSHKCVIPDRLSDVKYNSNGLIFGEPGSGVTTFAMKEIASVLENRSDSVVYVVDTMGSYAEFANKMGGKVVQIGYGSDNHINPLDLEQGYEDGEWDLSLKHDQVRSMLEVMRGKGCRLTPQEAWMLDKGLTEVYREFSNSTPTIRDLYDVLLKHPDDEAKSLANVLAGYLSEPLSVFSHHSNIKADNRLVIFDLNGLPSDMKELGVLTCLADIWNKTVSNRRKAVNTWFYVDDLMPFPGSDAFFYFLRPLWIRARLYGGVPAGVVHGTENFLRLAETLDITNHTSFVAMFSMSETDRASLADMFQISKKTLQRINHSEAGHGLLWHDGVVSELKIA